jgi:hypothetical protein
MAGRERLADRREKALDGPCRVGSRPFEPLLDSIAFGFKNFLTEGGASASARIRQARNNSASANETSASSTSSCVPGYIRALLDRRRRRS